MNRLDEALARARAAIPSARAAYLVGRDGLVAAGDPREDDGAGDAIAAWSADLMRRVGDAGDDLAVGPPREVVIASEGVTILSRPVGPEHALVVVLEPGAILGRARFHARREAERLVPSVEL